MKYFVLILMAFVAIQTSAFAQEAAIQQIKIGCVLDNEGTAHIHEYWDITAVRGTEWYLVRENLGDIEIENFSVKDENGVQFVNEGDWDVNRSLAQKANRCGIHKTEKGCELCWGLGSYGDHHYEVKYKMRNAAKSLNDYDMLHLQFVGDGLSSNPQNVRLVLEVQGERIDTTRARIWGFGYEGECVFKNGFVVMQSAHEFDEKSSLILLLRLDKGIINPTSTMEKDFQEHLDGALRGSGFYKAPPTLWDKISEVLANIFAYITVFLLFGGWIPVMSVIHAIEHISTRWKWLGTAFPKRLRWNRDIPFGGNILAANHVILEMSPAKIAKKARVASAMIIRMIQLGALSVRKDSKGKIEIMFDNRNKIPEGETVMKDLWQMMREAAGKDKILQESEFSKWSSSAGNKKVIAKWVTAVKDGGTRYLKTNNYMRGTTLLSSGKEESRKLYGLKNFLTDFTLIDERRSSEAVLWQDYLVYASLFGIADKVAKELKDIKPFEDFDAEAVVRTVYLSNDLGRSIMNAKTAYDSSVARSSWSSSSSGSYSSYSGGGGHSSYSGGSGYSGGGHGGGCR